ncbi:MAG: hypothetical protein ACO3JP_07585, partial [Schleiferiaceae bacterium]
CCEVSLLSGPNRQNHQKVRLLAAAQGPPSLEESGVVALDQLGTLPHSPAASHRTFYRLIFRRK